MTINNWKGKLLRVSIEFLLFVGGCSIIAVASIALGSGHLNKLEWYILVALGQVILMLYGEARKMLARLTQVSVNVISIDPATMEAAEQLLNKAAADEQPPVKGKAVEFIN